MADSFDHYRRTEPPQGTKDGASPVSFDHFRRSEPIVFLFQPSATTTVTPFRFLLLGVQ